MWKTSSALLWLNSRNLTPYINNGWGKNKIKILLCLTSNRIKRCSVPLSHAPYQGQNSSGFHVPLMSPTVLFGSRHHGWHLHVFAVDQAVTQGLIHLIFTALWSIYYHFSHYKRGKFRDYKYWKGYTRLNGSNKIQIPGPESWHSRLSHCLQRWHPVWASVPVPPAPLTI